ncbi:hypothetical protein [Dermacoccus nishinomiyaensis]|uniref:hypothetical protein n=1 Tax=Dermacoccus nishinomiyaensis TaxID=1274 RepID=UPI000939A9AC|nr:hypothetical protein [Dermacoccus nishinomiyaensis]
MTVTASARPSSARPTPPATSRGLVELESDSSADAASEGASDGLEVLVDDAELERLDDEDDPDEDEDDSSDEVALLELLRGVVGAIGVVGARGDAGLDAPVDAIVGASVGSSLVGAGEVLWRGVRVGSAVADNVEDVDGASPQPLRGSEPAEPPEAVVTKMARACEGVLTRTVRL